MKQKKNIAMLLVLAMLTSLSLSACGGGTTETTADPAGKETSADTAAETEPAETKDILEARLEVSDELPETSFDGRTFAMIVDDGAQQYYDAAEQTGEPVNDGVYKRNLNITERFDVKLEPIYVPEGNLTSQAKKTVNAGDDSYQLLSGHIIHLGMSVADGYMYNWNDLPHVDFSKPWWADSTVEDLTYNGKTFIAIGDMAISAIELTYCMFYNKAMADTYGIPDMYETVTEGKWTLDKLKEYSEGVYVDENGDGIRDVEDTYALSTDVKDACNAYLWAFGKKIATKESDGSLTIDTYYDEKLVSIVESLYDLAYDSGITYTEPDRWSIGLSVFPLEKNLFCNGNIRFAVNFRDVEFDYGIIPYPKWDESQNEYKTMVAGGHEGIAVLTSIQDPDFVGIIAEALNAESWKHVASAYYDTTIKFKGARDQQSVEILDMIMDSRVFDFGYVYGGWGCAFWIQYCLEGKNKDITSRYEKEFGKVQNDMAKVFDFFENE